MITRKCALSLGGYALTMLLLVAAMHIMSLFNVSKWVGVGIGLGGTVLLAVLAIALRKSKGTHCLFIIPANGVLCGLAASSLFVYLGSYPQLWESAAAVGALCAAFILYLLLTNIPFLRNHFIICMIIYVLLILAGLITGAVLTQSNTFYLALLGMIPFIAFFITTACSAENVKKHIKNMAYSSFAALVLVVIVVLAIISEGDGLDGLGSGLEGGTAAKGRLKRNPYDFYTGKLIED